LSLPGAGEKDPGGKYVGGKYVGGTGMWRRAPAPLTRVLYDSGGGDEAAQREAAVYGPKNDGQGADAARAEDTLSTVQVDLYQPERFGLRYTGPDGANHRPVMVHRSIVGSVERAVAHLIEVHAGAFPPWLAPTQLVILPVSGTELPRASALLE